jgi:hypothetical protein
MRHLANRPGKRGNYDNFYGEVAGKPSSQTRGQSANNNNHLGRVSEMIRI